MPKAYVQHLGGIDDRLSESMDAGDSVLNLRWDNTYTRWINDRGYAPYLLASPGKAAPGTGEAVRAITVLQTQSGGTQDILLEQDDGAGGCELYSLAPFETSGKHSYVTGRRIPTPQDVPTVFATFGRYAVAANGYDAPIKLYPVTSNYPKSAAYGWAVRPAPCQPQPISDQTMGSYNYAKSVGTDDVTVALPKDNVIGVGNSTGAAVNSYRYRYTWVSEDGSESPLSEASPVVTWKTYSTGYRYGVTVTSIQQGPPGTIARRIYRTKNLGATDNYEGLTYFYVADIANNYETIYPDILPDGLLGSEAPTDTNSAPLPANIRWITAHAGRAWIVSGDYRIHWSQSLQYEAFGAVDYVDVSARNGGRIMGLVPNDDLLIVLRERSIDAIYDAGNGLYRAVPLVSSSGSRAPHAALSVPGWGLLYISDDGVYVLTGSLSGGSQIGARLISPQVATLWSRVNTRALPQAYAVYNQADQEIIFGLPVDGSLYCNMQLVLHLAASQSLAREVWSTREGVMATCGCTGVEGFPLFGGHGYSDDVGSTPVSVWYGVDQWGVDPAYDPMPKPVSVYKTNSLSLGNPDQAKVLRYLTMGTQQWGNNPIYCKLYKDGWYDSAATAETNLQTPDALHTKTYGDTTYDTECVLGVGTWSVTGLTQIRFDFSVHHARRYAFEIYSDKLFSLTTLSFEWDVQEPTRPFAPTGKNVGGCR